MKSSKGIIYNFLRSNSHMTLATASKDGRPEAAMMRYILKDDYVLFYVTSKRYRKYQNLLANPNAACVVTNDSKTLQIDATPEPIGTDDEAIIRELFMEHYPDRARKFTEDSRFFKLKPSWMKMQDYGNAGLSEYFYEPKHD